MQTKGNNAAVAAAADDDDDDDDDDDKKNVLRLWDKVCPWIMDRIPVLGCENNQLTNSME